MPPQQKVKLARDGTITLRNRGLRATVVDAYQFGVSDPNEDLIAEAAAAPNDPDDWFDVRHTGAHGFDVSFGRVLEFAVTTYGRRSVANMMLTEVYIDVNGSGPDYLVQAADQGLFLGGFPTGQMVSAVFELTSGNGSLQFNVADDRNTAVQTVPILLDSPVFASLNSLGRQEGASILDAADPDFEYFVVTWDLETDSFDMTGAASFNAITPQIDTFPNFLLLPAKDRATLSVNATAEGAILILFLNNVAGPAQSQVVRVQMGR